MDMELDRFLIMMGTIIVIAFVVLVYQLIRHRDLLLINRVRRNLSYRGN